MLRIGRVLFEVLADADNEIVERAGFRVFSHTPD